MSRPKIYEWGEWRFEPAEARLSRNGEQVTLPGKTLDLLALLISRTPRLATKAEIMEAVWPNAAVEEGNIAFHIAALRKTLDHEGEPTCIETVRGRGYRFVAPVVKTPVIIPPSTQALDLPDSIKEIASQTPPPSKAQASAPQPSPVRSRPAVWLLPALAVLIMLVVVYRTSRPDPVLITAFEFADPATATDNFPESLSQFIVTTLTEGGVYAIVRDSGPEGESPRAAAGRLGADMLLTGTMALNSEQRWVVSLKLVNADDGATTWSWTFVAPFNEHRHQLQEQISRRVADGLKARLAELR